MEYRPDNWVVIKIKEPDDKIFYKVLAGWSGSYIFGSSWRMNSGIEKAIDNGETIIFKGFSGSEYICHKQSYGLRTNNAYIWEQLIQKFEDSVELMPEETDWLSLNYEY